MYELDINSLPASIHEIPQPPKKLYAIGDFPDSSNFFLTVVGSRRYTNYGKEVCEQLIDGLAGYPIVIVSGLAYGIDAIAHERALKNGLKTVAFPGSGLAEASLYPRANFNLAKRIVENGGCVVSEFEPEQLAAQWTFPQRNRLMAGISNAVLVIEAEEKSGTLITSKLAIEYNREVMTVPGSIFSETSKGPHMLLRLGATPITSARDILMSFGFDPDGDGNVELDLSSMSELEIKILEILKEPHSRGDLIDALDVEIKEINTTLSIMEIKGLIIESLGEFKRLK